MSRNKRRLCGALALLILLGGALAESVPEDTPAPTEASTVVPGPVETPAPAETTEPTETTAPAESIEPGATTEPSESVEPGATIAPAESVEPGATIAPVESVEPGATTEPSESVEPGATIAPAESVEPGATTEPSESIEPGATTEPSESVEPGTTTEPSETPAPTAPTSSVDLKPEGDARLVDQVWQIALSDPRAQITFRWSEIPGAERIHVRICDSDENVLLSQDVTESRISLSPADYPEGPYTLRITAWAGEELLLSEEAQFMLTQGDPGGRPSGGGRPGGGSGGSRGGSGGSSPEGMEEQGFRITPGEALSDSHASGSGDMRIYGTVTPETSDAEMTLLMLGETELNLTLDGGATFTASLAASTLRLQPVAQGARWEINLSALHTLHRSGIETLALVSEGRVIHLSTGLELGGSVYGMLRAQGLVAKDFTLEISAEAQTVCVNGARYLLHGSELATN